MSELTLKTVLIGESGVDKKVIILNINGLLEPREDITSQFVIKTEYFEKENKKLKFEIWDTAGQKEYRSLAKIFYKDAAVLILVYDTSNKSSFEELKNYWIGEIKNRARKDVGK
jgi:small GTP-binding protein